MAVRFVAHRAGNSVSELIRAEDVVETVEVDLHYGEDEDPEVRHTKRLWGTNRLWERWFLLPREATPTRLSAIVRAADVDTVLWADLKGFSPSLARQVEAALAGREYVVSSKSWWMLRRFTRTVGVQTFRSAGNRFELCLLLVRQLGPTRVDGAVVHERLLSPRVIRRLLSHGAVHTWAVNDVETVVRLAHLGVSGFIVDDLRLVNDARAAVLP